MNYAFQPADDTYVHFVSSQIREEIGKALSAIRHEKKLSVYEACEQYHLNPAMLHALEKNTRRTPWGVIRQTADKYGYDLTVYLKFSVSVKTRERIKPKNKTAE